MNSPTVAPQYLCPPNKPCLPAIAKMYCSNSGKVCGWPDEAGYAIGAQKQWKGKWYECFANGFQRVYLEGASCTMNSQCKNHDCGGLPGDMTCGGTVAAPATPEQVIAGLKSAGQPASAIAAAVEGTFGIGGLAMAEKLKAAGFSVTGTGGALKGVYDPNLATLGGWLLDAGWPPAPVTVTLEAYYGATREQLANFLKDAGQTAQTTAAALKNAFADLSEAQAAAALKAAGYGAGDTLSAVQAVFGASLWAAGAAAWAADYAAASVVEAMVGAAGMSSQMIEFVLDQTPGTQQALAVSFAALEQAGATAEVVRQAAIDTGKWAVAMIDEVLGDVYGVAIAPQGDGMFAGPTKIGGGDVGFPDICLTPTPAGPVPIPYPNIESLPGQDSRKESTERQKGLALRASEFRAGSYRLASGDVLVIRPVPETGGPDKGLSRPEVALVDAPGRESQVKRSMLLKFSDGGACAVCMTKDQVTSIRLLAGSGGKPAQRPRKQVR